MLNDEKASYTVTDAAAENRCAACGSGETGGSKRHALATEMW
jgi:hypothetical protein